MRNTIKIITTIMLFIAGITACSTNRQSSGSQTLLELAPITSLDLVILESFPVQVHAHVTGILSDSCTTLHEITQTRQGQTFFIRITTERPAEQLCADMITKFEQTVPLDVYGLAAGTYRVDANGFQRTFILEMDNASISREK